MDKGRLLRLIEQASAGSREAFVELCNEKARSILFAALRMTGNKHDAEDVAQEVMLKMHESIGRLQNPQAFGAWLNSIIVNECNMMRRKRRHANEQVPIESYENYLTEDRADFLPEEFAYSAGMREELLALIDKLPAKRRSALFMYYYQDMSYAEIAVATGTSIKTVSTNILRARNTLKKELEKKYNRPMDMLNGVVAFPFIRTALEMQARVEFPDAYIQDFVARVSEIAFGAAAGTLAVAGTAAAGTATASVAAGAAGLSAAVKAAVAVLCAAGVVTGAVVYTHTRPDSPAQAPLYAQAWQTDHPVDGNPPQLAEGSDAPQGVEETPVIKVPLSSPAMEESDRPQLPDSDTVTEEEGNIGDAAEEQGQQTSSPAPAALPAPTPAATPRLVNATVTGAVQLADKDGNLIPGGGQYLPVLTARLLDMDDRLVAQPMEFSAGTFAFPLQSVQPGSQYRLELLTPAGGDIVIVGEGNRARRSVSIPQNGGVVQADFLVSGARAPQATLSMTGGDCPCGHVNPAQISLHVSDALPVEVSWQIVRERTGEVIRQGNGTTVTGPAVGIEADGGYSIRFTVRDLAGNSAEFAKIVLVVSGEITPGQYK